MAESVVLEEPIKPGPREALGFRFPTAWHQVVLGDLFQLQQGKAMSPDGRLGKSPHPFLRTANVLWGRVDLTHLDQMDFTGDELERLSLRTGDLLVCEGGDVGRTAIWTGELADCAYQNHIHRLRAHRADVIPEFYLYWMQAAFRLFHLYGGTENRTTIPNLSKARLARFLVPHPAIFEQRAIADLLGVAQQAIVATERVVRAARATKRGLMSHLFTYGPVSVGAAANVQLIQSTCGAIPAHWRCLEIGKLVAQAQYGLSVRGERIGNYPILRMNNLDQGRVDTHDLQRIDLDASLAAKFRLNPGDVLFNRTNSHDLVGKTALFNEEGDYTFASYLVRLKANGEIDPAYLVHYLNWEVAQARLRMLATRAVSQSNISAAKLKTFAVPVPPLAEQEQIIGILGDMDAKLASEWTQLKANTGVFESLLTELMTGSKQAVSDG